MMITETVTNLHHDKTELHARMTSGELEKILAEYFECQAGTTQFEVVVDGKDNKVSYRFTWKF